MTTPPDSVGEAGENRAAKTVPWSRIAKAMLVSAVPVAAVLLHFVGSVSHETELAVLGVDSGPFQKASEWLLINGYYMSTGRLMGISQYLLNWKIILGIAVFALAFCGAGMAGKALDRRLPKPPPSVVQHPLAELIVTTVLSVAVYLIFPMVVIILVLFMIGGAAFGEAAGRESAERKLAMFQKGCDAATLTHKCVEIHKDGKIVSSGFLIDSSDTHLAIFDVQMRKSRVVERVNTELVGPLMKEDASTASGARQSITKGTS